MKKSFIQLLFITFFSTLFFSFDWPQDYISQESFNSYFGQNRGNEISSSLIFSNPTIVKAAEDGNLLIIMNEENDDSDFFPSTLGNSIILSHHDSLLSVYANLQEESITVTNKPENIDVYKGEYIAETGNSGWQDKVSSLEFQIIDTKNSSSINPKLLMTRTENEVPLSITNITLENKNGNKFDLNTTRLIPSGLYKVYQKRNEIACPYKSTILLNGVVVDNLAYDIIVQENGKKCILGKKKYTLKEIYPDTERHLLGEAMLTPGKTTLTVDCENILGQDITKNFSLTIK